MKNVGAASNGIVSLVIYHALFLFVQVKTLTELCLFAEAVKEIHSLGDGEEVPLPHNSYTRAEKASV